MASRRVPRNQVANHVNLKLNQANHEAIVQAISSGCPVEIAAGVVGVVSSTLFKWLTYGKTEFEFRQNEDYKWDKSKDPFVDLYLDVDAARDKAAARNVLHIQKAAQGGTIIEETTRTYRDENGNPVKETTVKKQPPDWRAAAWWLERRENRVFGKEATRVEISGPGGGAVQIETVNVESLEARFAANLALQAASKVVQGEIESSDEVVEAEVVDEFDE